jgi:exopolysaccharide biosynthesis WecB/TagA/CpsF family protein
MATDLADSHGQEARARFAGVSFSLRDADAAIADIRRRARSPHFAYVVTPNADHVVRLEKARAADPEGEIARAYDGAAMRLCDSRIIQRLARFYSLQLPLVPGSDLTARLFRDVLGKGDRVAIIGGDADMVRKLRQLYPAPDYVQHIPPMGLLANSAAMDAVAAFVRENAPHYIFFAVGAPQSEIVAMRCAHLEGVGGVGLCVGASIAFLTGDLKRAPAWLQRMGLEWAHRLLSEPRRLWRRYLVESPKIFWIAWRRR